MPSIPIGGPLPGAGAPAHKTDVIDVIMAIDNELVEWILHARPTNDEEKAEMRRVLALRTQIEQQLNALVLSRMKLATQNLKAQSSRLDAITTQLRETGKTVGTVKEVVGAAAEALTVIGQVVAVIA